MKKKKLWKQILSITISTALITGSLGLTGFAKEKDTSAAKIPGGGYMETVPDAAAGKTYYVDSNAADGGDGTIAAPFNKLEDVNAITLNPGEGISLKCGSVFDNQTLAPKGKGTPDAPILINTYGTGDRPVIHAGGFRKTGGTNPDGTPEYAGKKEAVLIENMEYVFVTGLEVTNDDDFDTEWNLDYDGEKDKKYPRRLGIHVTIDERVADTFKGSGDNVYKGIVIDNCYVHNVDGNEHRGVNKVDGGIGIEVIFSGSAGIYPYFDGVTIQKNRIDKCDRTGIKGIRISDLDNFLFQDPSSSDYDPNCDADNNGANDSARYNNIRSHRQAHKNYRVVGNYLSDIGGDGILVCETTGAVVEHNVLDGQAMRANGANAGIWSWNAFDTVFRYNESFHGPAYNQDGCSFDSDYFSAGSVFEYNYSHDTPMGFMLLMGGNDTDIVRYNVSQNDGNVWRHVAGNSNTPSYIYNNVFLYDGAAWKYNYSAAAMAGKTNWQLYNNIFYNTNETTPSNWGGEADWSKVITENNIVYEASGQYGGPGEIPNALYMDPKFVNPGAGKPAVDGVSDWASLDCYKLQEDSPAINAGAFVDAVPVSTDGNAGHWDTSSDRNATVDFFGNPLYNGTPDIGITEMPAYQERQYPVEANASYLLYDPQSKAFIGADEAGDVSIGNNGAEFILANSGSGYKVRIWNQQKNAYLYLNASGSNVTLSESDAVVWSIHDQKNGFHALEYGGKWLTSKNGTLTMEDPSGGTAWQLQLQEGSKYFNTGGAAIDGFSAEQQFNADKKMSGSYGSVTKTTSSGSDVFATGITGEEFGYKIFAKDGEYLLKLYLSGKNTAMDILVNGEIYETEHILAQDTEVLELGGIYPVDGIIDVKLLASYNSTGNKTNPVLNGISAEKTPMAEVKMNFNCGNTNPDGHGEHDGLGGDVAYTEGGSGYYSNGGTATEVIDGRGQSHPVPDAGMATALKMARAGTDFGYKFKVKPGNYRVKLYFNMMEGTSGIGDFDITVNGDLIKGGFNILSAAGAANKAVDITEVVSPQNGLIDIGFMAVSSDKAMINAIVLEPFDVDLKGENLAAQKPVSVSGSEDSTKGPENAVDLSQATRWASGATYDETWISVDLEKEYMVDTVVIDWTPGAYATNYRVEVKTEGSDWEQIKRVTSAYPGINVLNLEPVQAQQLRIVGEAYNDAWGMSLTELSVYGEEIRGKAAANVKSVKAGSNYDVTVGLENIYNTYRTLRFSVTYDPTKSEPVAGSEQYLAESALATISNSGNTNSNGTKTLEYRFDFKKQGAFKEACDIMKLTFKALSSSRSEVFVDTTFTTADGHETKLAQVKTYVPNEIQYSELVTLIASAQRLSDEAVIGEKPGQYTNEVKAAFDTAIAKAREIPSNVSMADLEKAFMELEKAIGTFKESANTRQYQSYHKDYAVDTTADFSGGSPKVENRELRLSLGADESARDNQAAKLKEGTFFVRFQTDSVEDQTLFMAGDGIRIGYDSGGGNWFFDSAQNGNGWGDFTSGYDKPLTAGEEHTIRLDFTLNDSNLYDLNLWYDGQHLGTCNNIQYSTAGGAYGFAARRNAHNLTVREVYYTTAPEQTITVSSGDNGSVSQEGSVTTFGEADKTFLFDPEDGYKVDQIIVDGTPLSEPSDHYTFDYITKDHTLEVSFKEGPGDKTPLKTAIQEAKLYIEADYTKASYKALMDAVTEAEALLLNTELTKSEIQAACIKLETAAAELVSIKEIRALVNIVVSKQYDFTEYTKASGDALSAAIVHAQEVLAKEDADAQEVSEAINLLKTAQEELVSIKALQAEVEVLDVYTEENYTPESWAVFVQARTEAEAALAKDDATALDIEAALNNLKDALSQLDPVTIVKDTLQAAIQKAAKYAEGDYTKRTWQAVADALSEAERLMADDTALQENIDQAAAELNHAVSELVSVKELLILLSAMNEISNEGYTQESWDAFDAARLAAAALLEKEDAAREEIDQAITDMEEAYQNLITAPPEPDPEPDPGPSPEPDPGPNPEPDPGPSPEPNPEPDPGPSPEPNPEPDPGPSPEPNPEPDPGPNPDPGPGPEPSPSPDDGKQSMTTDTEDTSVPVITIQGTFGADAQLSAERLNVTQEEYETMKSLLPENMEILGAFDVIITGEAEGPFTLSFHVGVQYNGKKVLVLHKKDSGQIEQFEAIVEEGIVQVTVDSLSPFMLALQKETSVQPEQPIEPNQPIQPNQPTPPNQPSQPVYTAKPGVSKPTYSKRPVTGDNQNVAPLMLLMMFAVTTATAVYRKSRHSEF